MTYSRSFVEKNQTARISLQIPTMSKSKRQKPDRCALNFTARPPRSTSNFPSPPRSNPFNLLSVPPVWRPVVRLSAAGEGGSKATHSNPQVLFCRKMTVFAKKMVLRTITMTWSDMFFAALQENAEQPSQTPANIHPDQSCPQGE